MQLLLHINHGYKNAHDNGSCHIVLIDIFIISVWFFQLSILQEGGGAVIKFDFHRLNRLLVLFFAAAHGPQFWEVLQNPPSDTEFRVQFYQGCNQHAVENPILIHPSIFWNQGIPHTPLSCNTFLRCSQARWEMSSLQWILSHSGVVFVAEHAQKTSNARCPWWDMKE